MSKQSDGNIIDKKELGKDYLQTHLKQIHHNLGLQWKFSNKELRRRKFCNRSLLCPKLMQTTVVTMMT
jgi:hypothetical protein